MNPLNLYSLLLAGLLVLIVAGRYLLRGGVRRGRLAALVLVAVVLLAGWWLLRPVQTPHEDASALTSQIGAGTPVLLEFQSPY